MSENEATSELPESSQDSGEVRDATIDAIPESISLGDYDPEGPIGASAKDAFADLLGDATAIPEVEDGKSDTQVQEEESEELDDSEEGDSDDSDIETAEAETDGEEEDGAANPELFHIDDLKDENVHITMKVDGEERTYTADEIQKILGTEAVATRKSKTATQELEKADARLAEADQRIAAAELVEQYANGAEELSLYKAQYAQVNHQISSGDLYGDEKAEAYERRDAIAKAHNEKLAEVNDMKAKADTAKRSAVRQRLEKSERGRKFLSDRSEVESFNQHLASLGVTQTEWDAVRHSPAILDALLEHREMKQSTKPVQRKKRSVKQTIRKGSSTASKQPASNQPKGKGKSFTEAIRSGESISLNDINEGKVEFDFQV